MTDGLTMNQLAERNAELVSEVEKLNQKLLAYEQAAKNPVAWIEHILDSSRAEVLKAQPASEPYKPNGCTESNSLSLIQNKS